MVDLTYLKTYHVATTKAAFDLVWRLSLDHVGLKVERVLLNVFLSLEDGRQDESVLY